MLVHRKGRLALSMLGIAFSVVIMFMEIGFFNGLNDSQARLATILDADLVLMSRNRPNLIETDRMNRLRLQEALALDGVTSATPLYEGMQAVQDPVTELSRLISVVAFPPGTVPLRIPGLAQYSPLLATRGNILFDGLSRDIYGKVAPGTQMVVGGEPCTVVGVVPVGPSIKTDGYLLMGDVTWLKEDDDAEWISMGLLKAKPGTDIEALRDRLVRMLGDEATVMTPEEVREREWKFTAHATPAGGVFAIGVLIGFAIGVIICYQILFNEITDNMPQYATVKAIGFSKAYLVWLVMQQALILAVLGFLPGLAGGQIFYSFIQHTTRILMFVSWPRAMLIFVLTVFMCTFSGMLAVRKVLRADPAEVF
jgi:putative ABC transport system permease protein